MHSSRMRTGRSLTVCWRLLPGGGGGAWSGGVWSQGGAWSGGCLVWGVPGGGAWCWGSGAGGVWSQACLVQGVCLVWGVPGPGGVPSPEGCLVPGGVCSGGGCLLLGWWWYPSMH